MRLNTIRNFAVAALLSTTLMSGAMASTAMVASELLDDSKPMGAALKPIFDLQGSVPAAKLLHDEIVKAGTGTLFPANGLDDAAFAERIKLFATACEKIDEGSDAAAGAILAKQGLTIDDLSGILVGKTAAEIDQEHADHHWNAFLASKVGQDLAKKDKAHPLSFASGMKAEEFLAQKPTKLSEAQDAARAANEYYDPSVALPRNITEIGRLQTLKATAGISTADVNKILTDMGLAKVAAKLKATDGKGQVSEALAKLKTQKEEADTLLAESTKDVLAIKALIASTKLAKASGTPTPPPPASPKASPLSSHKKAEYNPADFNGMPLLTIEALEGMTDIDEQARLRKIFESMSEDQKTAYLAEAGVRRFTSREQAKNAGLKGNDLRNWDKAIIVDKPAAEHVRSASPVLSATTQKYANRAAAVAAGLKGNDLRNWESFTN